MSEGWLSALRPYIEREDYRMPLTTPIHMASGQMIQDVAAIFLRFPRWTGAPFTDDFGKKAAGLIDIDGEHTFAELAVLRLLQKDGWDGRWVNTYSGGGEVWKFLTEWKDLPRQEQKNRPIEAAEPRQLLARIAGLNKPARYSGCWDVFAWRESEFAFFECKRVSARSKDTVKKEQEDWLRSALYIGDERISSRSFCFIQWDYIQ